MLTDIGCDHIFSVSLCQGTCVGGHGDSPGDYPSANAADPSAASPVSPAAPSPSPAAASSNAAAGNVGYLLQCSSMAQRYAPLFTASWAYLTILHLKGRPIGMLEHKCSVLIEV